jgi:Spy/CpxP family protein refolding chaperone
MAFRLPRALCILSLLCAGTLSAQLPRRFYAWWGSPVVQDLHLTDEQQKRVRETLREYRPHLQDIRTAVDGAEQDVEEQFNADQVNPQRVDRAIERLIAARAELTRTLTQMSLKLRTVLTQQQWQELQRRRPGQEPTAPPPPPPPPP